MAFECLLLTGEFRDYASHGLTQGLFEELKGIDSPPKPSRLEILRHEFILERALVSEELKSSINALTHAAGIKNAEFVLSRRYGGVDLYTRLPLGVLARGSKSQILIEMSILEKLDKVQMQAEQLFGLYKVYIDMGSRFQNYRLNDLVCLRNGWGGSLNISIDYYEKMSPQEQERFVLRLCREGRAPRRMRGSLPFP